MKKFTTSASGTRADSVTLKRADIDVGEPTYPKAQRVDPSTCIEPLGELKRGAVDINSPAYTGKFPK